MGRGPLMKGLLETAERQESTALLGRWLTTEEAAGYLRMEGKRPDKTLQRYVRLGRLKAGFNGKRYIFLIDDLDALARKLA